MTVTMLSATDYYRQTKPVVFSIPNALLTISIPLFHHSCSSIITIIKCLDNLAKTTIMERKFYNIAIFFLGLMLISSLTISCKKEKQEPLIPVIPPPKMEYFNLNDQEIIYNGPGFNIDVNHDGRKDLIFKTLGVGDPLNQVDKHQFLISSYIKVNLPVNNIEEIPIMNRGDSIILENFNGYQWFELSSIILVQKIISFNNPPIWVGHWKNSIHKFLPYQVVVDEKRYNGWVELSVNISDEKIILHKAAISKDPNKTIKAGE